MQRHLSLGSTLLSALMAAQRRGDPNPRSERDAVQLLASLGTWRQQAPSRPAPRDEKTPPAA